MIEGTGLDLTQLIVPAIIALVMVGIALNYFIPWLKRRREPGPTKLSAWSQSHLDDLRPDGRWTSSMSWFNRSVAGALAAPRGGKKGGPVAVAEVRARIRAALVWVLHSEIALRVAGREIRLTAGGFFDWPFVVVPRIGRFAVFDGARPMGSMVASATDIVAYDTHGVEVGRWQTDAPLGAMLPGADEPVYGRLVLGGRALGQLRVPRWRTQSRSLLDFPGVPFLVGHSGNDDDAEPWLLAFLALSAQASLYLQSRSPHRPRALNER